MVNLYQKIRRAMEREQYVRRLPVPRCPNCKRSDHVAVSNAQSNPVTWLCGSCKRLFKK